MTSLRAPLNSRSHPSSLPCYRHKNLAGDKAGRRRRKAPRHLSSSRGATHRGRKGGGPRRALASIRSSLGSQTRRRLTGGECDAADAHRCARSDQPSFWAKHARRHCVFCTPD
ncbi:hypothetical protein MRX96_006804 [Rhipicephalus microplus]